MGEIKGVRLINNILQPKLVSEEGRTLELEWILRLVLFGIVHWVLAIMLLQDLAARERVLGGRKFLWVLVIMFVTFIGSLIYLSCHPQIFFSKDDDK